MHGESKHGNNGLQCSLFVSTDQLSLGQAIKECIKNCYLFYSSPFYLFYWRLLLSAFWRWFSWKLEQIRFTIIQCLQYPPYFKKKKNWYNSLRVLGGLFMFENSPFHGCLLVKARLTLSQKKTRNTARLA